MAFVCKLTDATEEVDLFYSATAGFSLLDEGIKPGVPEQRLLYGGIVEDQLVRHYDGKRQIPLELFVKGLSDDDLINRLNTLQRLLKKARDFHLLDYGDKVFLEFKLADATYSTRFPVLAGQMDVNRVMSVFCKDVETIDHLPLVLTCKPYWESSDTYSLENFLGNPHFEEDGDSDGLADCWNKVGTPTTTIDVTEYLISKYWHTKSQKAVTGATGAQGLASDDVAASATNAVGYAWVYKSAGDQVAVELYDSTAAAVRATALYSTAGWAENTGASGHVWKRLVVTATGLTNGNNHCLRILRRSADASQATTFYVDKCYLEFGTTTIPTGWMSGRTVMMHKDAAEAHKNYIDVADILGDIPSLVRLSLYNTSIPNTTAIEGMWIAKRDREKVFITRVLEAEDSIVGWVLRKAFSDVGGILCLKVFGSYQYAGTGSATSKIYRSLDGITWDLAAELGDGNVSCLEVHGGYLYAGTQTRIFRTADGTTWVLDSAALGPFGFASHAPTGKIYACGNAGKIYRRDAGGWVSEYTYGTYLLWDLLSDGTDLYCTTSNSGNILRGTGAGAPLTWAVDYTPSPTVQYTLGLALVGSVIYAGSRELPSGTGGGNGRVFMKSGGAWSLDKTFDEEQAVVGLGTGSTLYFGTGRTESAKLDGNIYKKVSGTWTLDFKTNQGKVFGLEAWGSDIYAGTDLAARIFAYLASGVGTKTADSDCSGGYHQAYSGLSATTWAQIGGWDVSLDDIEDLGGFFRIIGRAHPHWTLGTEWRLRVTEGSTFVYATGDGVIQEEQAEYLDFGAFALPPWVQDSGKPRSFRIELEYKVVSGGPYSINIDYLMLLPLDGFRILQWSGSGHGGESYGVDDGIVDELFISPDVSDSEKRFYGNALAERITLLPQQAQRLYFLAYDILGSMPIAQAFRVRLKYRPRGVHLRGTE